MYYVEDQQQRAGVGVESEITFCGYGVRTVQELLRRKDVKTTMIYTHVLSRGGKGVKSPLDNL